MIGPVQRLPSSSKTRVMPRSTLPQGSGTGAVSARSPASASFCARSFPAPPLRAPSVPVALPLPAIPLRVLGSGKGMKKSKLLCYP